MKTKIFIAIIALASLMSCNTKNSNEGEEHEEHSAEGVVVLNDKQQKALDLKLGTVQMRNLTTVIKTNGKLEVPPSGRAAISAIIGGNVQEIKVFNGDKVTKGEVLVILEHPNYIALQEDFSEIANRLEFLKQEYDRQKELYENNAGAGKDYQKAKYEYNTAKAKFQGLKARLQMLHLSPEKVKNGELSNTVNVVSPINGYVNEVNIKVGSYVDAKDVILEITDNSAIHADFMIYEKDVHLIKQGQKIHFTVSNRPDEELTANIYAIEKEFEGDSRAVHIHAKINEKVSGLIPGMYISGHLHADEKYTQALPNDAIVKEGTKSYIFIQDEKALEEYEHEAIEDNDKNDNETKMAFRMVEIITGQKDDGYTEIHLIDTLPANTQVVLNAAYYLLADMKKDEAGDHD